MIVKIMGTEPEQYLLYDNIESLEVEPIREIQQNDSNSLLCTRTYRVVCSIMERNKPSRGFSIKYQDKCGEWCSIMFNTVAYICGDDGKTLEVIRG